MLRSPINLALFRTIKGVKHYAYESESEFRKAHPRTKLIKDWKKAKEGQWCLSHDDKIVQILKKGSYAEKRRGNTKFIRTIIGMFNLNTTGSFAGTVKDEMHRFSKKSHYYALRDTYLTDAKKNFVKYIAHGMEPVEAYMMSFPKTTSRDYAETRSALLLKNKTVRQAVDKEIENLMSEVGITKRYLLETTKDVIDRDGVRDNDKLRAVETLMKIAGLLNMDKKVDSVALIQEFTGFSREKLEAFEQGILPEKQKELTDG
tara:strand:+ start:206 stop:985 length:780 start_codon:yes stop_codon:yes gene_type:complete